MMHRVALVSTIYSKVTYDVDMSDTKSFELLQILYLIFGKFLFPANIKYSGRHHVGNLILIVYIILIFRY